VGELTPLQGNRLIGMEDLGKSSMKGSPKKKGSKENTLRSRKKG